MKIKASSSEVIAFHLWLQGKIKQCRQRENLLPVYVACPEERERLLIEFLREFHAEHRYRPMVLALFREK